MKHKILLTTIALSIFLSSCKKDSNDEISTGDISTLVVPASFTWQTARDVNFNVAIHDTRFQNALHIVEVFQGDPAKGGTSLAKGAASVTTAFKFKAEIPAGVNEVYLIKTAPDGTKNTQKAAVESTEVSFSLGSESITQAVSMAKKAMLPSLRSAVGVAAVDYCKIAAGEKQISSKLDRKLDMNNGDTYVITGSNYTVEFQNVNGGNIRVCGTGIDLRNLKVSSGVTLIVAEGASVTFNNFNMEGGTFTNLGTAIVKSNLNLSGKIENGGDLTVEGNYNANNNPEFTNSGTLSLGGTVNLSGKFTNTSTGTVDVAEGNINFNGNPTFLNSGTFTAKSSRANVSGSLTNSGNMVVENMTINSGTLTNTCFLNVLVDFDNNATINNHSYIQVDERSNLKGTFNLHNAAMFRTKTLIGLDGTVTGHGNTSLFKVDVSSTSNVNDNGSQKFKNALQYCDPSRTIQASQFTGGAMQACDVYIAINNCNPAGNGIVPGPVLVDTDGDGIIDTEDDYPEDKTKAFNNYSVNYENGGSTVAFEDSWPMKGDYDLNDVVIGYKYLVVTSATNQVVHIKADYALLATGGEYQSGAGIQFNLPAKSAANFKTTTGVKLEGGQDSVVVILFTSSRNEQATWNTIPGQSVSPVKNYDVSFDVVDGPQFAAFGIGTYNPFIWNTNRGNETHMIGKTPTKFANADAFGTNDDNSKAGKSYSTKTNLPWAISVPIRPFQYPSEKIAITDTYLRFGDWATSGGTNSKDWYANTESGYRNTANIYKAN